MSGTLPTADASGDWRPQVAVRQRSAVFQTADSYCALDEYARVVAGVFSTIMPGSYFNGEPISARGRGLNWPLRLRIGMPSPPLAT